MKIDVDYRLSPGVRARPEKFGLLLYNSKDTNLTFIKSGNLLTVEPNGLNNFIIKRHCKDSAGKEKVNQVLKKLVKKGLIVEIRSGI